MYNNRLIYAILQSYFFFQTSLGYAQTFVPFVFLIFGIFFGLLVSMIEFVFGYFLNPKNSITHTPVTRLESPTESNLIKGAVHVLNLLAKRISQQGY